MKKTIVLFLLISTVKALLLCTVSAQKAELMLPEGHTGYIYSVAYSPDSKSVLTTSADQTAKRWDVQSGKLLQSFEGHSDRVTSASFSPDGMYIVTGSDDGTSRIWNAKSGKKIHSFTGMDPVFSPDSKTIATNTVEKTIQIRDVQSGALLSTLQRHKDWIRSVSFNLDSKTIVSASDDKTAKIWNVETGKLLYTLKGHSYDVLKACFNPDGKTIVTASRDKTAKIWDVNSGKLLFTLTGHSGTVSSARFSPDGKRIVTASTDKTAKIWDSKTGELLITLIGQTGELTSANYSPDGKNILTTDSFYTIIWDVQNGKLLHYMIGRVAAYSPDGNAIVTARSETTKIWDAHKWKLLAVFEGHTSSVYTAFFSPESKNILTVSEDHRAKIWDIKTGKILHMITDAKGGDAIFSPDGKLVATTSDNYAVKIWDAQSGKLLDSLSGHTAFLWSIVFSPDSKKLATVSDDSTAKIWEVQTGRILHEFPKSEYIQSVCFSPDGKYFVTNSDDYTTNRWITKSIKIWDTLSWKLLYKMNLDDDNTEVSSSSFSPDSKYFVKGSNDCVATVVDLENGDLLHSFTEFSYYSTAKASYIPDGKSIFTVNDNGTASIWDIESEKLLLKIDSIQPVTFSPDSKSLLSTSQNFVHLWDVKNGILIRNIDLHLGTFNDIQWSDSIIISVFNSKISLFDLRSGNELLSWVAIDSTDWVVLHPSGLFDASPGAMEKMYYVQGDEVIELNQLKDRYYEPGLWEKVMGSNTEPLRNVTGFEEIKLTPAINLAITDGLLDIKLEDRGGGIGKYLVFINGKEVFTGNIPVGDTKFRGGKNLESNFNLKNHPYLLPDKGNEIEVKAYNGDNYMVSRGEKIIYNRNGSDLSEKPRLFIISLGISDYTGDILDLKYAAKDAEDMAMALSLGAKNLFGSEKTFTFKKTTNDINKSNWPTKEEIIKTFAEVAKEAKSTDVLVVYISGHGINWGGQDGDFYYLTQDAYSGSTEVFADPVIREKTTLSSAELTELIKSVSALKEVLIIDACASGRTVENLMAKRDISSSTLRALDRMKDRTGLHIITGCAADAVSYEASRYGQGVLTYSLLEGIKGASLREEKFVDVVKLFQYSAERVPQLAGGIGGIQQPQIFSPYGESSFDIGEILSTDKKLIPLSLAKPMFLMSSLKDKESFDDDLGMEKLVDEKLRDVSSKSASSPIIFIEAKEYPEAYRIRGAYDITGSQVEIMVNIFLGSEKTGSFTISGKKTDLVKLAEEIVAKSQGTIKIE